MTDYHTVPKRLLRLARVRPVSQAWASAGCEHYARCLETYEAARRALIVRRYGLAGLCEGMGL